MVAAVGMAVGVAMEVVGMEVVGMGAAGTLTGAALTGAVGMGVGTTTATGAVMAAMAQVCPR